MKTDLQAFLLTYDHEDEIHCSSILHTIILDALNKLDILYQIGP